MKGTDILNKEGWRDPANLAAFGSAVRVRHLKLSGTIGREVVDASALDHETYHGEIMTM
jgi:hypothetical protein